MATVNFSVPEEVKDAFNRTFAKQNKSAIIADLMRKAVEEAKRQKQREAAFRLLTARRSKRPSVTDEEIRTAREESRS
jgi:metal-responsive CopG/Arc/MetJ family transcriptional regulator